MNCPLCGELIEYEPSQTPWCPGCGWYDPPGVEGDEAAAVVADAKTSPLEIESVPVPDVQDPHPSLEEDDDAQGHQEAQEEQARKDEPQDMGEAESARQSLAAAQEERQRFAEAFRLVADDLESTSSRLSHLRFHYREAVTSAVRLRNTLNELLGAMVESWYGTAAGGITTREIHPTAEDIQYLAAVVESWDKLQQRHHKEWNDAFPDWPHPTPLADDESPGGAAPR